MFAGCWQLYFIELRFQHAFLHIADS